jgi:hypothetical protein
MGATTSATALLWSDANLEMTAPRFMDAALNPADTKTSTETSDAEDPKATYRAFCMRVKKAFIYRRVLSIKKISEIADC